MVKLDSTSYPNSNELESNIQLRGVAAKNFAWKRGQAVKIMGGRNYRWGVAKMVSGPKIDPF